MTAAPTIYPATRRFARFAGIVPPDTILSCTPIIVGCGAIGSHIARLLAHMGIPKIVLVDPDTVSPENLGPQCYLHSDLNDYKVFALADLLSDINPNIRAAKFCSLFESAHLGTSTRNTGPDESFTPTIVFSCVDSMAARTTILDAYSDLDVAASLLIDCRMGGESAFILTCDRDPDSLASYRKTLFPDSEAEPLPCGQTSSPHNAACCASLAVHALSLRLRGSPVRPITCIDLRSLSLFPASHSLLHPTPPPAASLTPTT